MLGDANRTAPIAEFVELLADVIEAIDGQGDDPLSLHTKTVDNGSVLMEWKPST
jgi:hypothetical protein